MKQLLCTLTAIMGTVLLSVPVMGPGAAASDLRSATPFIWHAPERHAPNLDFSPYTLGSNDGAIVVDGKLTHDDSLGLPFNRVLISDQARDRSVPLTGWVKDDGDNLYVTIDISRDRRGSRKSDASVFIKQPHGIAELRLSELTPDFGMRGGFETRRARRHHNIFEFKIPLHGLNVESGNIEIAFAANDSSRG